MNEHMGLDIEDGKIFVDKTKYNYVHYRTALKLPDEYAEKFNEIKKLRENISKLEREIKDYVSKDFKPQKMPNGMEHVSTEIGSDYVFATWKTSQISIVEIQRSVPPMQTPSPRDPYIELSMRPDFKSILGSGILTKDEKRKCLGLPSLEVKDECPF